MKKNILYYMFLIVSKIQYFFLDINIYIFVEV